MELKHFPPFPYNEVRFALSCHLPHLNISGSEISRILYDLTELRMSLYVLIITREPQYRVDDLMDSTDGVLSYLSGVLAGTQSREGRAALMSISDWYYATKIAIESATKRIEQEIDAEKVR